MTLYFCTSSCYVLCLSKIDIWAVTNTQAQHKKVRNHFLCKKLPHPQAIAAYTSSPLLYYPGQKNRYSREIHEVDRRSDHVISCDIKLRFDSDLATRLAVAARRELALQIEVDVARYHMIALRINLMNISAVPFFLARVVDNQPSVECVELQLRTVLQ